MSSHLELLIPEKVFEMFESQKKMGLFDDLVICQESERCTCTFPLTEHNPEITALPLKAQEKITRLY